MPRTSIAEFLLKKPNDHVGKVSMLKGMIFKLRHHTANRNCNTEELLNLAEKKLKNKLYCKEYRRKMMQDPEKRQQERLRVSNFEKLRRSTPGGREIRNSMSRKSYHKHLNKERARARRYYEKNKVKNLVKNRIRALEYYNKNKLKKAICT